MNEPLFFSRDGMQPAARPLAEWFQHADTREKLSRLLGLILDRKMAGNGARAWMDDWMFINPLLDDPGAVAEAYFQARRAALALWSKDPTLPPLPPQNNDSKQGLVDYQVWCTAPQNPPAPAVPQDARSKTVGRLGMTTDSTHRMDLTRVIELLRQLTEAKQAYYAKYPNEPFSGARNPNGREVWKRNVQPIIHQIELELDTINLNLVSLGTSLPDLWPIQWRSPVDWPTWRDTMDIIRNQEYPENTDAVIQGFQRLQVRLDTIAIPEPLVGSQRPTPMPPAPPRPGDQGGGNPDGPPAPVGVPDTTSVAPAATASPKKGTEVEGNGERANELKWERVMQWAEGYIKQHLTDAPTGFNELLRLVKEHFGTCGVPTLQTAIAASPVLQTWQKKTVEWRENERRAKQEPHSLDEMLRPGDNGRWQSIGDDKVTDPAEEADERASIDHLCSLHIEELLSKTRTHLRRGVEWQNEQDPSRRRNPDTVWQELITSPQFDKSDKQSVARWCLTLKRHCREILRSDPKAQSDPIKRQYLDDSLP